MRRRIFLTHNGAETFLRYLGLYVAVVAAFALAGTAARSHATNDGTAECGYYSADANDVNGPPIHFAAELNADEESAVTESPGVGHADFTLDRKTLKFSWKLTFKNLTSPPTGAAIRGPQTPGGEAGVLYDMSPGGVRNGAGCSFAYRSAIAVSFSTSACRGT